MKYLKEIVLLLIFMEVILTGYLVYEASNNPVCFNGNCDEVQNSHFGEIFGIKISVFGFVLFGLLFIFSLFNYKNFFSIVLGIPILVGSLFSLYFLSIQIFILKKFCLTCVLIDGLMLFIFLFYSFGFFKGRNLRR